MCILEWIQYDSPCSSVDLFTPLSESYSQCLEEWRNCYSWSSQGRLLKDLTFICFIHSSQVVLVVKDPLAKAEDSRLESSIPGWGRSLENEMATHSSIFAWEIPWTEDPGKLQSLGSQRVGYNWVYNWEKAEEPEIKLPTSAGSLKKQENSRKTSISALLTMPKPLTVWITINYGKF